MKHYTLRFCFLFLLCGLCFAKDKCCNNILLDTADPESDVHILQGGRLGFYTQIGLYGEKAQYKQVSGDNYIYYSAKESLWLTTPDQVGSKSTGITSESSGDCIDSSFEWKYYNGSHFLTDQNLTTWCAEINKYCCSSVQLSSPPVNTTVNNSSGVAYAEEARKTLGKYTAVGTLSGRFIYQHGDMDRYLQFDKKNMNWLVVNEVGSTSGFLYHSGGSVCAENSGARWHAASSGENNNTFSWQHDPQLHVTCLTDLPSNSSTTQSVTISTKVVSEETTKLQTTSDSSASSAENTSQNTEEHADTTESPSAKPLISDSADSEAPVTAIIVSVACLVVFSVLAVIFTRRFRTSWRSGSHGRQLVLETFGLHRNNI